MNKKKKIYKIFTKKVNTAKNMKEKGKEKKRK